MIGLNHHSHLKEINASRRAGSRNQIERRRQRVDARNLRPIRDFMREFTYPIGFVVHAGEEPRLIDDKIIGMPFRYL